MTAKPIKITPTSSAPVEQIANNIKTNLDLIPTWFQKCRPHNKKAYICSAGPSLEPFLQKMAYKRDEEGENIYLNRVFICVKHALPLFKKYDIIPHFCSVLDPRPIDEVSTLGKVRSDLYSQANDKTVFIVASMTHTSVTKWLLENNKKVLGYHTATPEINALDTETRKRLGNFIITGGTSSATRSIEISFFLGCIVASLVGFDSSFIEPKPTNIVDLDGKQLYMKINVDGNSYYTTGEFIAQAQDIQSLLKNPKVFSNIDLEPGLSTSLVHAIERKVGNLAYSEKEWMEYLEI